VRIIEQGHAVGRWRGVPYLQVFGAAGGTNEEGETHTPLVEALLARVPRGAIDWDKVMRMVSERRNLAVPITPRSPALEAILEAAPLSQR
jgi:hypothetical protein